MDIDYEPMTALKRHLHPFCQNYRMPSHDVDRRELYK